MPPSVTDNEAESNEPFPPLPPPAPLTSPRSDVDHKVPPKVMERMRRVTPDMARHYKQRAGQ
ncbi:UBact family ubiquitin protein [Armatimonas sp.]|uniref:UBact family ubiquitin protein n=1 Tax=Armatimonas sp. TaxID=1872638 RepID=UPI00286A899B|nr:UBact family ubiquitin protein [Armatimonas sp.]